MKEMERYKILIVEDDEIIAREEKQALEQWDYQIECVQDFKHVLQHVERFMPELILMDIHLPVYNGFYWCQQIRTVSKAPVVFACQMRSHACIRLLIWYSRRKMMRRYSGQHSLVYSING